MNFEERKIHKHTVKSLITDNPTAVYESLLGNALINRNLVVLEDHCVILRRDHKDMHGKVKIIGGGGAGIEPAEASYVGKGMLTAAVIGEIFTAPSVNMILAAIRELIEDSSDTVLLLVKNYIGDKLNFRLAMEQAWSEGLTVKMLIIGDDIFPHNPARHGRKGIAGSVLVYKILGEMAEDGKTMDELIEYYKKYISNNLATASATLVPCTYRTCNNFNHAIQLKEMVLGMGIYGKGGSKKVGRTDLMNIVKLILEEIISYFKFVTPENDIVVMVNNLGGTTKIEEAVIAKEVTFQLSDLGFTIAKFYVGTFMSSLGSQGFSVSILNVFSEEIIKILNRPTSALAWPRSSLEEFDPSDLPITITPSSHEEINRNKGCVEQYAVLSEKATAAMKQIILFAVEALISCEIQLNVIDSDAGDGDAGTELKKIAEAVKEKLLNEELSLQEPFKLLSELSEICHNYAGGLTSALYSVFFREAAKVFQSSQEITSELCCKAFREAVKAIKCYGNAELQDRTILDALYPALESFETAIKRGGGLPEAVFAAAVTCEVQSEQTKHIKPPTLQHINVHSPLLYADAGTHAASIWFRAVTFDSEIPCRGPGIFVWKFLNEEETAFLMEQKIPSEEVFFFFEQKLGSDEYLLSVLLIETLKFCRANLRLEKNVISALLGTVHYTHLYFTASKWRTAADVYFYFRESILRQSVESPPVSMEVFLPNEAKASLIFFTEIYIRNLPLISILHLPHYKLHLGLK